MRRRSPDNNRRRREEQGSPGNNRRVEEQGRESPGSPGAASGSGEAGREGRGSREREQERNNLEYEKRLRQLRRRMRETDWAWLSACMGVVEGDSLPVEAYLNGGGDPTRYIPDT